MDIDFPDLGLKQALRMTAQPHQTELSDRLHDEPGQIAFHGLGTGKTFTAINAAEQHKAPLVAIVPAALRNNMRKEIAASGFTRPSHVFSYQQAAKMRDDPAFHALTRDAVVAYDEAHRAGRAESVRSELPGKIPAKKKLFLSGTPLRNEPHEIAPLVNAIQPGSLPEDPAEFRRRFIEVREKPLGFWGRLTGKKPEKTEVPKNLEEFENAVRGKVHFYQSANRADYPSFDEKVRETPMNDRQQATYNFVLGHYPSIAYKIRHGLPMSKNETKDFTAFMSGPRQVSNHPAPYNVKAKATDSPKIEAAADAVAERHKADKNYRGVSYSAFLGTGVHPLSEALKRRGIPHAIFTGEQDDKQRKKIVEDYNTGKVPHLLISGAGAEGLDLKGTKLMQIMEPHWNEELINQVRGRAIRYKSHAHLPEHERHVSVERYHSVPQRDWIDKITGRKKSRKQGVDEYVHQQALHKLQINAPFLRILKGERAVDVAPSLREKTAAVLPDGDEAWFCVVPEVA